MRVCLLAGANCIHTTRWCNGLVDRGLEVHLISAHPLGHHLDQRVGLHMLPIKAPLAYLTTFPSLRKLLRKIKPDLLNAHYATGYGLMARLSGFEPSLLSVWGTDVYEFYEKSPIHRWLLKGNLHAASAIGSTSLAMARQASKAFAHEKVFITPFGIDEQLFAPSPSTDKPQGEVVIGTVKALSYKYGIDTLIQAFALTQKRLATHQPIRLEITGGGSDLEKLKSLAKDLGIADQVVFHGPIEHDRVPEMLNRLDIYVALSRAESFGVAILEANACEKPVVVSDADGPAEVTVEGVTGLIVPKEDPEAASWAIERLVCDEALRRRMGKAGREHVMGKYSWQKSLDIMIEAYRQTIAGKMLSSS